MTKLNPENCKNCSSKCAYDCGQLQYTIQNRTVLIILPPDKHHSSDVVYQRRGGIHHQKARRRGLISIQESIYMEEQCLCRYTDDSEEELLVATRRENILNSRNGEDNKQLKHRLMLKCKQKWMIKPLHRQFLRQTQQSWAWLTTGG